MEHKAQSLQATLNWECFDIVDFRFLLEITFLVNGCRILWGKKKRKKASQRICFSSRHGLPFPLPDTDSLNALYKCLPHTDNMLSCFLAIYLWSYCVIYLMLKVDIPCKKCQELQYIQPSNLKEINVDIKRNV